MINKYVVRDTSISNYSNIERNVSMNIYSSTKVTPYVYICTHNETGRYYIGYREQNVSLNRSSDIDFPIYKTSSKLVNARFDEFKWIIVAEFSSGIDAYDFEQQLIFENWNDPLLLNESCHYNKARFRSNNKGINKSESHKEKLKVARNLRPPHSEETKKKIANGNLGKIVPPESRERIANAKKGSNNPMFGKIVPTETREKKREANKKYLQRLTEQNILHPSKGFVQIRISCLCCKKVIPVNIFSRYHGNNCKHNRMDI
jgi:hypothetical protein